MSFDNHDKLDSILDFEFEELEDIDFSFEDIDFTFEDMTHAFCCDECRAKIVRTKDEASENGNI